MGGIIMRYSIQIIKRINRENGRFFFSPAAMHFFNFKIHNEVYQGSGGVYFISSIKFAEHTPRVYSVKKFNPDNGECRTVKNYCGYTNIEEAINKARKLAKGLEH